MRLAILTPPIDSRPTGLGVYVKQVVPRLVERCPDSILFSADDEQPPSWAGDVPFVAPHPGLAGRAASHALPRALRRQFLVHSWLPGSLSSNGVDVLFIPFQIAAWNSAIPQVVVIHDLRALRLPATSTRTRRTLLQLFVRPSVRRADRVIAVSQSTRADLMDVWRIPAEKIDVVYEGFDAGIFQPYREEQIDAVRREYGITRRYVIYVGTFARHKNLGTILQALTLLEREHPALVPDLVVAGRPDAGDYSGFAERVRGLGLTDRVRILGYVDDSQLGPLIAGADAFLFPTLYEGFGLSALEAMACGAPVIAAHSASLPEVVGDGGHLLDPHDPRAWAQTLATLLTSETESQRLSARGLRRAAEFNWDRTADRLVEILEETASRDTTEKTV